MYMKTEKWVRCIGGLMLVTLLAGCADQESADGDPTFVDGQGASEQGTAQAGMASGDPQQDGAQQALQGLLQIRQEQCQSGNQLACDALPEFPGHSRQLAQSSSGLPIGRRPGMHFLQEFRRTYLHRLFRKRGGHGEWRSGHGADGCLACPNEQEC